MTIRYQTSKLYMNKQKDPQSTMITQLRYLSWRCGLAVNGLTNSPRTVRYCTVLIVVILGVVTVVFTKKKNISTAKHHPNKQSMIHDDRWNPNPNLMHNEQRCQKALIYPFRVGCPASCRGFRGGNATINEDDPFYRLTVTWYLGEPQKYNASESWDKQHNSSTYKYGINFECPEAFVRTFQLVTDELAVAANQTTPPLVVRLQQRMHVSLSYLCCLSEPEVDIAKQVISNWIEETDFDFTIRFHNIQCWHEYYNSVTNIVLVDSESQNILSRLNHDLNKNLVANNVPIYVPREDQMPYHTTILQVRYGDDANVREMFGPEYDISGQLPTIYNFVERISNQYINSWNGNNSQEEGVAVHRKPRFSHDAAVHTGTT